MTLRIDRLPEAPSEDVLNTIRSLFMEYNQFLDIDLDFQGFKQELADLPGRYAASAGGALYIAYWQNEPAGCVAFYPFALSICELKRLFVRPAYQGQKMGVALFERAMVDARNMNYTHMRLDSLHRLESARQLYLRYGFTDIAPYNENPHSDVYYMERAL